MNGLDNMKHMLSLMESSRCVAENTGVTDYSPKSQGGTRKELLAKYRKTKNSKDAEAARKAGATQKELKKARDSVEEACGDMPLQQPETHDQTSITYSKTHVHGDASATVSATAKNIEELESVLRLAGLDPNLAQAHEVEPAVEPEHKTAHIDMPYSAPADIGYSTDAGQLKQHLLNQMQGYLR